MGVTRLPRGRARAPVSPPAVVPEWGGVGAQNLVGVFGRNRRADQRVSPRFALPNAEVLHP